jgi:hypothetical protein
VPRPRFLAAYGADVLRLDPPGFAEVPAPVPETTAGKRTAFADLTTAPGRETFERLAATADVLVTGLRADALARLGYDDAALAALNPALIAASLNAYGWDGPWRDRRGFDSLVQMSSGIAAAGARAAGRDKPFPLPVQGPSPAGGSRRGRSGATNPSGPYARRSSTVPPLTRAPSLRSSPPAAGSEASASAVTAEAPVSRRGNRAGPGGVDAAERGPASRMTIWRAKNGSSACGRAGNLRACHASSAE